MAHTTLGVTPEACCLGRAALWLRLRQRMATYEHAPRNPKQPACNSGQNTRGLTLSLDLERVMRIDNNFPTKLFVVDDVPEPFRGALQEHLSPSEQVVLIYSPAFSTLERLPEEPVRGNFGKILIPASVLAVTDDRWLVLTKEEGEVTVEQSVFRDTLFLELTSILLSGQLRIYYASVDRHYVATVQFNTVHEEFYREAIGLVLNGIDQKESTSYDHFAPVLNSWPLKYRLEAERYRPKGQRLITATRWTSVESGLNDALSPSGALLITEGELVAISEQKVLPRQQPGDLHKFGGIITFCPLLRLSDFHISRQGYFGVLTLLIQAPHGSDKLNIVFPLEREKAVFKTMQCALKNKY